MYLHPGTGGDAALARGLDDVGFGTFLQRHAVDDALLFHHFFFGAVQIHVLGLGRDLAGHFVHQAGQAAHLLHLLYLRQKIVQVKAVAAFELGRHFLRGFYVDIGSDLFDQGDDIAHAQHAPGMTLGVKGFQAVDFFTGAGKLNRRAGDLSHRQRRTAA